MRISDWSSDVCSSDLRHLPADRGQTVALAGASRQPPHLHAQLERVAGRDLAPEAHLVDPAEEWELAGEARLAQDRDRTHLGQRLHHEHAGQRRPAREVAYEE